MSETNTILSAEGFCFVEQRDSGQPVVGMATIRYIICSTTTVDHLPPTTVMSSRVFHFYSDHTPTPACQCTCEVRAKDLRI